MAVFCPFSPQWAAVRKTVGETRVPVQYVQVPSACGRSATMAPTSGWAAPSAEPFVMAAAGRAVAPVSKVAAIMTNGT
ncbi:hypothetical protein GCM10009734_44370 [Nonomuraea bangladeshensis]